MAQVSPTLWFVYAARNLRSGLSGFWILLACLFLGVASIAAVGSLAAAISRGLAEQGQPLLGGDVEFSLIQREATADELAFMASKGETSLITTMRGMATASGQSTLVEIKAVDGAYPLYGEVLSEAREGEIAKPLLPLRTGEVVVDPLLLGRLGVKPGDTINIGTVGLKVAGVIGQEPDRISDGFVLGPRLLMSHGTLAQTGLVQPGSLITWRYRVRLPDGQGLTEARQIVDEATAKFPQAGWRVRATDGAAAGAERFSSRLAQFLTLVAVAALVVGGAGIGNAVSAFVSRREPAIATLKCLGLSARDVIGLYFAEILLVGLLAIGAALALGAATPFLVKALAGDVLPLPVATTVNLVPLVVAGLLGVLVLLAFALLPLSRIAQIRGVMLFRGYQAEEAQRPDLGWFLACAVLLLAACGLVVFTAESRMVAIQYLAGLAGSFLVLAALAYGLLALLRLVPKPGNILLRQAVAALQRKGGCSFSIILALGLGLSLFVTLSLTDRTIGRELTAGIPGKAPAFFFLDVRNEERAAFEAALREDGAVREIGHAPMLRGRIVKVKGVDADKVNPKPGAAWALRGDRGLTYADELPQGSELVKGTWWRADYAGPPLVSLADEIADGIGVTIGDKLTVNVLGREIEVEVASLRRVNWRSMGINFVMVFTPKTLEGAPHSHIVTVEMDGGDEGALLNRMAKAFPSVTAVRVKDAIATVSDLLGKMLAAVRGANGLTLLTGVLVLAGALAAGLAGRSRESVILKTFGATRRQLVVSFVLEYGFLGLVAAIFGIVTGSLGAWYLAHFILEMPWQFDAVTAVVTALLAMALTILGGLAVTWRALSVRPSVVLRNE